jgi:hypothetical protein
MQKGHVLGCLMAYQSCGLGQTFFEQHDRAKDDAQGFKKGAD